MSVRREAAAWLAKRGISPNRLYSSRLYQPEASWTGARAWWVQIPAGAVRGGGTIDIVCETGLPASPFRHLQVPADFFVEHLDHFATIADEKINLFLSAEPDDEMTDRRGPGKISFKQFELSLEKDS